MTFRPTVRQPHRLLEALSLTTERACSVSAVTQPVLAGRPLTGRDIEPRFLGHRACSFVTVPTELHRPVVDIVFQVHLTTTFINLQVPCILYIGQAFRYSPENAFYIFNQQIYFII